MKFSQSTIGEMHRITYFYMYGLWQCPDNKLTLYSAGHWRIMEAIVCIDVLDKEKRLL